MKRDDRGRVSDYSGPERRCRPHLAETAVRWLFLYFVVMFVLLGVAVSCDGPEMRGGSISSGTASVELPDRRQFPIGGAKWHGMTQ